MFNPIIIVLLCAYKLSAVDPYLVLQLSPFASQSQVTQQYTKLTKKTIKKHPKRAKAYEQAYQQIMLAHILKGDLQDPNSQTTKQSIPHFTTGPETYNTAIPLEQNFFSGLVGSLMGFVGSLLGFVGKCLPFVFFVFGCIWCVKMKGEGQFKSRRWKKSYA